MQDNKVMRSISIKLLLYQERNHSGFIQEILEAHIKREGICTIIAVTTLSFCLCIRKLFQD